MGKILSGAVMTAICLLLAGCGYFSQYENLEKMKSLRVGMTQEQVKTLLGDPVEELENSSPDIWFYYTGTRWHDGYTTEDECTPMVFRSEKLIGWGNQFYNHYRLVEKNLYQPENYQVIEK